MNNEKIKAAFDTLIEFVGENVEKAFAAKEVGKVMIALDAYNRFEEEERDGVDYIFHIRSRNDIATCVNGGMTARDIHDLVEKDTEMFMFGENHPTPERVDNEMLRGIIMYCIGNIVTTAFIDDNKGYDSFIDAFLRQPMVEDNELFCNYFKNFCNYFKKISPNG